LSRINNDLSFGMSKSFGAKDDFILNYRPNIAYVEPEQVPEENVPKEAVPTLDIERNQASAIVNSLGAIASLCDEIQKKVDDKVNQLGGINIKLDPSRDFATISAMKRRFPDRSDPTTITYDDYRKALDCLGTSISPMRGMSVAEIQKAQMDPLRTNFGGLDNVNGENRPEISSPLNIQPLDIPAFQQQALIALFAKLQPMITDLIKKIVPGM
jgi:hypothetical protein